MMLDVLADFLRLIAGALCLDGRTPLAVCIGQAPGLQGTGKRA